MRVDLDAQRGDTNRYDFTVTNPDGSVRNIGGALFWFTLKRQKSQSDAEALLQKGNGHDGLTGITVTDVANGYGSITLDPEDLEDLEDDLVVWYDLQIHETNEEVTTLYQGTFTVEADVTRATA